MKEPTTKPVPDILDVDGAMPPSSYPTQNPSANPTKVSNSQPVFIVISCKWKTRIANKQSYFAIQKMPTKKPTSAFEVSNFISF